MKPVVAVVGATGNVGRVMLETLERRGFPLERIVLLASKRSAGQTVVFRGRACLVRDLAETSFKGVDVVLASAGAAVSREFAPRAAEAGAVVVDNSSAFRMEAGVPLVVPEVNVQALAGHKNIVANPNCSTAQLVTALAPLHRAAGIKRLVIATYQSVSGTGRAAVEECLRQARSLLDGAPAAAAVYPHPIAFNVMPHCDQFEANGYTREEMKLVNETRKILGDPNIAISATAVRVPVLRGHAESVNVEIGQPMPAGQVRKLLSEAPGVCLVDDPADNAYPMPLYAEGRDEVFVGRVREDISCQHAGRGFEMFIVADNLLKGAALNAVQIAEELLKRGLLTRQKG
jgi:aspartate-semialdehyde dehydrogenase